ncbi:SDR family NAD(P)-dependent oxidoreductase [Pelagibius sp. Alg239-R121]|uniref:SDR family NAD(P)-dependent oxidoreductase n=1 Tax=Pelagibius sp. Alg239-R121 TaxID=2993448 RepID=UPI0024A6F9C6|nr:SDR family oxidoreductase [Pelagibius sp. Alg239-R121]
MQELSGQVAIVTGASRGIGEAAAKTLGALGVKVVLAARRVELCQAIAKDIEASGGQAIAVACDVSDFSAVTDLAVQTRERFGPPGILINNAGVIEPIGGILDSHPDEWAANVSINLLGVYHCIRAVLPGLLEACGVVINISSGAAHTPLEGWSAYCSSKAGVAMLTQATALEYAGRGLRVFGFAPGTVDTDMQVKIKASGINPVSQMAREDHAAPEVPAQVIAYLCSSAASDLAGKELTIRDPILRQRAGLPD